MNAPTWFHQLTWSAPRAVRQVDPEAIPPGSGLYVFSADAAPLTRSQVLYIGKADGARQTLRTRVGRYLHRFKTYPRGRPPKIHHGMEDLAAWQAQHGGLLYVRWCGVVVARELEGTLIAMFDPPFNHKDEHRLGFADDEVIPGHLLYEWP